MQINWTEEFSRGGGHLYSKVDIIRDHGLSKITLNTYFRVPKKAPHNKYSLYFPTLHKLTVNLSYPNQVMASIIPPDQVYRISKEANATQY